VREREEKDIAVFWLNQPDFSADADMPFFKSVSQQALVFENAYAAAPLTVSAMENAVAGLKTRFGFCCGEPTPASAAMVYWKALNHIIGSSEPQLVVLPSTCEIEGPCWCPELDDYYFRGDKRTPNTHSPISKNYFDRQTAFYAGFFAGVKAMVFVGGHGEGLLENVRATLMIQGNGITQGTEERLFSCADFDKLANWLVDSNADNYHALFREEAIIHDVDGYASPAKSRALLREGFIEKYTGYRAAVTKEDIYIRYNNGMELFRKHVNDGVLFTKERLDVLRGLTGDKSGEAVGYIYEVLERYRQRKAGYEERKTAALKKLLQNICSGGGTLALYPGGMATYQLLLRVGLERCAKVRYVIDSNPECLAGKLGIEVISPECLADTGVGVVVKTTHPKAPETVFLSKAALKDILSREEAQVIDIYEYLAENGCASAGNFWDRELTEEDIGVGIANV
jgi:hypothetical protein